MSREDQKGRILTALRSRGPLRKAEIAAETALHEKAVLRCLTDLVVDGAISREGENRDTVYRDTGTPRPGHRDTSTGTPGHLDRDTSVPVTRSDKDLDRDTGTPLEGVGGGPEYSQVPSATSSRDRTSVPEEPGHRDTSTGTPGHLLARVAELEETVQEQQETVLRLAAQLQALAARAKVAVLEGQPLSEADLEDAEAAAREALRQERARAEDPELIDRRQGGYFSSIYNRLKLQLLQGDRVEVDALLADLYWREVGPVRAAVLRSAQADMGAARRVYQDLLDKVGRPGENVKNIAHYALIADGRTISKLVSPEKAKEILERLMAVEADRPALESKLDEARAACHPALAALEVAERRALRENFTLDGYRAEKAARAVTA